MIDRLLPRALGLLLTCASIAFVAAAPAGTPGPFVTPPPPSAAPATPAGFAQPSVIVYPFDVQTGVDPKLGAAIATILAQEMASAGGVTVLAVPDAVKRADFLDHAHSVKADFYISGYVVPVGDTARVVEQVVSVESGVILFSQTAQVTSVADVASQSLLARTEILNFVGRDTGSVQTETANTPAPTSTNGANVPISGITNIVDSVFKHKGATHAPSPTPAAKPARGVIVAPVTASGSVAGTELANAGRELYFAMNRAFNAQMTAVTSAPGQAADEICGANRNNTIATGTLQELPPAHNRTSVTFTLTVYTCFGATLEREVAKGTSLKTAVDGAVAAYVAAHPDNS